MPWIIFEDEDRRTPVPYLRLESLGGEEVTLERYYGRENLVLFFAHRMDCPVCQDTLNTFARMRTEYGQVDATVLVVFPEPVETLRKDPFLRSLPWTVVSDPQGATRRSFVSLVAPGMIGEEDDLLFVLDQYGAPYAALFEAEFDSPNVHQDVLKWLEFIGVQCPE